MDLHEITRWLSTFWMWRGKIRQRTVINAIPVLNLDVAVNMFQIASGYLT